MELVTAFVQRKGGTAVLAKSASERETPRGCSEARHSCDACLGREFGPALVEALTKAGGLSSKRSPLTHREIEQVIADVVAARQCGSGRENFPSQRSLLPEMPCHRRRRWTGWAGLISLGAAAPIDYLIDSILLPNKAIKENYHSLIVSTRDGRVFMGIKVRETASELILRDAEDREVSIPIQSIEERANGGSLMPEGLADSLTRTELVDLVRFLSELGKVGPFAVSKSRLVRRVAGIGTERGNAASFTRQRPNGCSGRRAHFELESSLQRGLGHAPFGRAAAASYRFRYVRTGPLPIGRVRAGEGAARAEYNERADALARPCADGSEARTGARSYPGAPYHDRCNQSWGARRGTSL